MKPPAGTRAPPRALRADALKDVSENCRTLKVKTFGFD
jgi:hypothetical protein